MSLILTAAAFLAGVIAPSAAAIELPPSAQPLTSPGAVSAWLEQGRGSHSALAEGGRKVEVTRPDEARSFCAQFSRPLQGGIGAGDKVLVVLRARVVGAERGEVVAKVQLKAAPYTSVGSDTAIDLFPEWREYPLIFEAREAVEAGKGSVTLLCGHRPQQVEVSSIEAWRFPPSTPLDSLPRLRRSYPGREADAPWRREALERIERIRKADLTLAVRRADGSPAPAAPVRLRLVRHAFGFGSATPAHWYSDTTPDATRYRDVVDRLFSMVVFENDLKDFGWAPDRPANEKAARNRQLDAAFAWLSERHIAVRGHYLMQVAVPPNLHALAGQPDATRRHVLESAKERLAFVGDRVVEWDVINHPVAWAGADLFSRMPGLERLDEEVFDLARAHSRLPMLVNEDQLFRPGPQSEGTFRYVQRLKAAGYPVAGLGNQAHVHESYLPSPAHVLAVTDHFAEVVPRQIITEFDVITTGDEELAADYTRDILIACFSHPAYSGFLWWGFWEGNHWKPEAASWNRDWSLRGRGKVMEEWLGGRWRTELVATPDADGRVHGRGFPGMYAVSRDEPGAPTVLIRLPQPDASVRLP